MAACALQPSELEIQREVEALRDLRRRSITPGALAIDPDLPPNQSPPSPSHSYWSKSPTRSNEEGDSSSSSHEGSSIPRRRSSRSSGSRSDDSGTAIDDPFHLFWVPASLHPEIAPAEFRAFLKEHARTPTSDEAGLSRSSTVSSFSSGSNLSRRTSMLSRQYQPTEDDGVEDENVVPLRRNRSNIYSNQGPQLTINDLQKLEQLAEEASNTDDPSKLRNILRRSLSLNVSPSALSSIDEMPDLVDEADAPIIVPPPGQILRRAARTKIRKPSLAGDGGGHRFSSTRRGQARAATAPVEPRTSSDLSSSEHGGESVESEHISVLRDRMIQSRPESYSEETLIIDAYARDDEEELHPRDTTSPEPEPVTTDLLDSLPPSLIPPVPPQLPLPEVDPTLFAAFEPVLFQPQPQPQPIPARTPDPELEPIESVDIPLSTSPPSEATGPVEALEPVSIPSEPPRLPQQFQETPPPQAPPQPPTPIPVATPAQSPPRKEKDKKGGLFSKWGSDKSSKKAQKNTSEKETGFFSSLFGGSKKKQESESVSSASGREAAQALLGASKNKTNVPANGAGLPPGIPPNNYSRYPIHVERAIYRLSHIKLANPRRPLYEQVLISNLMFWYLGVINKAQPSQPPNGQITLNSGAAGANSAASTGQPNDAEKAQKDRAEKERQDREQREQAEAKKKESGKRGSLTKAPAGGSPGGGRRAEIPVKGPQYEMQHRVMEQEYVSYAGQGNQSTSPGKVNSTPNIARGGSPPIVQPQPQPPTVNHSEPQRNSQSPSPPRLNSTSPAPGRRSQSPPSANSRTTNAGRYSPNSSQENLLAASSNGRLGGRSLSATAVPSPPMYQANGRARKGVSAYAAVPPGAKRPRSSEARADENGFEEEDIPLAVWQQQRKR